MNTRIEETLSAATTAFRFVQRNLPAAAKSGPLIFTVIAGAGVAVGIGAGLLFAPQSGSELRESLRSRENTKGLAGAIRSRLSSVVSAAEEEVSGQEEREAEVSTKPARSSSRRSAAASARAAGSARVTGKRAARA